MIPAAIAFLLVGSYQNALLGRSLTWDPQGLVPFEVAGKLSPNENEWISVMQAGEYGRASMAAKHHCLSKSPSFFAIWVVAESARVRKDLSELAGLASSLADAKNKTVFSRYASYRHLSLKLAITPSGAFKGNLFVQNPEYPVLVQRTHEAWKLCVPFAQKYLPVAVAMATGRERPSEIRDVVLKSWTVSNEKDRLLMWKARAQLIGRRSVAIDMKSKQPERRVNGRPAYFFLDGDGPDIEGAGRTLTEVRTKFPDEPKLLYYDARLLSWKAAMSEKESDRRQFLEKAVENANKFLRASNQSPTLIDSAKKFLKYKDPVAFNTPPIE